jgi:hypothetical protein
MADYWQEVRHFSVFLNGFSRKAIEDIPGRSDLELDTPFKQRKVVKKRGPLFHVSEEIGAKAFDTRLDSADASGCHHPELFLADVRLCFVEKEQSILFPS